MKKNLLIVLTTICCLSCYAQTPYWLPSNGLIAWYPFTGNANDESGNSNNGTLNNVVLTTDRFGNSNSAYSFNGSTGYISVADNAALRLSNTDFTISAWVYETNLSPNIVDEIISKRMASSQSGYHFGILGTTSIAPAKVCFQVSGGNDPRAFSNANMILNNWQNIIVVYTFSSHSISIYINGVLNSTVANIPSPSAMFASSLWIGNDVGGDSYCFHGSIDDIAIYNRALQPCEIVQLHSASSINITQQPANQSISNGNTATFFVSVGDSCLTYQWQQDCGTGFINLSDAGIYSGAHDDTLVINPISFSINNCHYRCIMSSCIFCTDTTSEAVLSVTTGLNELSTYSDLYLSPNPFIDEINVSLNNNFPSEIFIYDIASRKLLDQKFTSSISLATPQLAKGMYVYEVRGKNGLVKTGKLIKD